ncbi:cadherin repeat domain-containing protein [Winogradskyella sp. PG-2]|uniref:cadherin repeat domain-containing protein n=1 Tax=Winogradskyella sp. PG-2 TaxID=754409 RepID=UPI0004588096|nr:cadherin repeat domain-containing protein [Winogradskyella sp. PG-2]BAO76766.1 hypothetical protein WPG_2536 [Winogradskyella sp. PG-2]
MKFKFNFLLFFGLALIISCSADDTVEVDNFTPSASDITLTIDENPSNGQTLCNVATNLTGSLVYSISSQSPTGAIAINNATGEITINDSSKFDYEINSIIEATITVTNSLDSAISDILITLNNIDDILSFLSTSQQAYQNAMNGEWILVTEDEYNMLATKLYDIQRASTSDEHYNIDITTSYDSGYYTYSNNNGIDIAPSQYIFAIKYKGDDDGVTDAKVKVSSNNIDEGFIDLGQTLLEHNAGDKYFVLKGNSQSFDSTSYLGISGRLAYVNVADHNFKYKFGDSEDLTSNCTGIALYQGLTTTVKQWD